jgi:hypothetical protein
MRKLQTATSSYSIERWEVDNKHRHKLVQMICRNSDRYCKNPYFLHSVATSASTDQMQTMYNQSLPCKQASQLTFLDGVGSYYDEQRRRLGTASSGAKKRQSLNYPPSAAINQNGDAPDSSHETTIRPQSAPRFGRPKVKETEEEVLYQAEQQQLGESPE